MEIKAGHFPNAVLNKSGIVDIFEWMIFGTINFTNKIAELAEEEDHHPAILLEWGRVEVTWWTHKIGGLHKNDFIAAAKTDLLNS